MTVVDIKPRIVEQQVDEIEKLADMLEVIIEHTDDDEVRAVQEDKLHELRKQIDVKRERLESEKKEAASG